MALFKEDHGDKMTIDIGGKYHKIYQFSVASAWCVNYHLVNISQPMICAKKANVFFNNMKL